MASELIPVSLVLSIVLGISINVLLFRIFRRNLLAFLLSLLGIPFLGEILKEIGNSMIRGNVGLAGVGLVAGVIMAIVIGLICYTAASLVTSVLRWRKHRWIRALDSMI